MILLPTNFQPLPCTTPSAAVSAAKLAHPQWLLLPTHFQSLLCAHAVRICPRPSAQPSSLIPSDFFSPPISNHSFAPTPSAAVRGRLRSQAHLCHPQRLLLPTHFQPLPCTHAVRSRPRSQARSSPAASSPHPFPITLLCTHAVRSRPRPPAQPSSLSSPATSSPHPFPATPLHPRRPQPSAQPSSLIPSGFYSPTISRHSLAPRRLQPSAQPSSLIPSGFSSPSISSHSLAPTPSAAVRAAKLAHPQRLLLPTHFQPLPCSHAVRSRPRMQAR